MDLTIGLAAAGNAISIAKTLKEIDKNYDAATYKLKTIELIDGLTEAKGALVEARERIADLERENETLRAHNEARSTLVEGEGGYQYRLNDHNERYGFPVCPKCLADTNRLVAMVQNEKPNATKCPSCRSEYKPVTAYVPASKNEGTETTELDLYHCRASEGYDRLTQANQESSWLVGRFI